MQFVLRVENATFGVYKPTKLLILIRIN